MRLQWLHDELVEQLNSSDHARRRALVLPEPPLPGTRAIEPLRTAPEVIAEGRGMHHCVASYVERVATGAVYIYRVDSP